jgi:hypothetical protein
LVHKVLLGWFLLIVVQFFHQYDSISTPHFHFT